MDASESNGSAAAGNGEITDLTSDAAASAPTIPLSKSARKKQLKQQRLEQRKADRKRAEKERRKSDLERRRREWDEKLSAASEEEKARILDERKVVRKERMEKHNEEKQAKTARLRTAAEIGRKIVVDLEFADMMKTNEIHSLVHQVMFCYAVNGKCPTPAHLWLTGCTGEIQTHLQKLPGYDRWIIEKESKSYIDALQDQKENLVYLTADADEVLEDLDQKKIYVIGGLVDRNRWKGITLKKAQEQGIQSARLPISSFLKMSSSQVLTVNQVFEILLKFIETKDWKSAFFHVIPQRKIGELEVANEAEEVETDDVNAAIAEGNPVVSEDENDEVRLEDGFEDEDGQREYKKKRVDEPGG